MALYLLLALHGTTCWGQSQPPSRRPTKTEMLTYCLQEEGNIEHGSQLFRSEQLGCSQCHSVDGSRSRLGPDLFAIGDKFGRREIVQSVLYPSEIIADGYEQTLFQLDSGLTVVGLIKQATPESLDVATPAGSIRLPVAQIEDRQTLVVSAMPHGAESLMSLSDMNDLVEYLVSLKQPENAQLIDAGMPRDIPGVAQSIEFEPVVTSEQAFDRPVWMIAVPESQDAFLVIEHQAKRIWYLDLHAPIESRRKELFVDLGPAPEGEGRLSCLAFHPQFATNRKYYLYDRQTNEGKAEVVIEERQASADGRRDSGSPPREILRVPQSTLVHFGGWLDFGSDGYLYITLGDSGPQEDPLGNAQNSSLLLGKILRLDVDRTESDKPYAIPADNPYAQGGSCLPEVWASGFRAPWRCSFDPSTGDLWVGDVGQDRYEEVDLVRRGDNFGWNVYEGFAPFSNNFRRADQTYVPPVFAYARRYGPSVTGGYVYRGQRSPTLVNQYVCGDYESKRIFAISARDRRLVSCHEIGRAPQRIVSFAIDKAGELYVVGYEGMIYRIDPSQLKM